MPGRLVLAAAARYGGSGFFVGFAAAFGFALVPVLFALGHGKFAFNSSISEIKASGDERMTLELRLSDQFAYLLLVKEELSRPE